jgi:hypothetical protein
VTDSTNFFVQKAFTLVVNPPPTGQGPYKMWPGYADTTSLSFYWWVPLTQTAWTSTTVVGGQPVAPGVIPDYYNVYRSDIGKIVMNSPPLTKPGVIGAGINLPGKPMPFMTDNSVSPGTTYTYTVTAVSGTTESAPGPPLTMSTLPVGSSALPDQAVEPDTWIVAPPAPGSLTHVGVGNTLWLCTSTAITDVAGTSSVNPGGGTTVTGCSITHALNNTNIAGGDVHVWTAGSTYPIPTQGGYFLPAFTGTNGFTFIVSSEAPEYAGVTGRLPAYNYVANPSRLTALTATAPIPAGATSATLSPNQTGFTDATGKWILKSGYYFVEFVEPTLVQGNGSLHEERLCLFLNGSSLVNWSTTAGALQINALYPTNAISGVGTINGGSVYNNGTFHGLNITGGTGVGALVDSIVVTGGAVTSVVLPASGLTGSGFTVGDVMTAVLNGGTGFSVTVTAIGTGGAISTTGTLVGGNTYTNGTFTNVALTGGHGTTAKATLTITGGAVTSVAITAGGINYQVNDVLSATLQGGTGFSFLVGAVAGTGAGLLKPANNTLQVMYLNGVTPWDTYDNIACPTINLANVVNAGGLTIPVGCNKVRLIGLNFHAGPSTFVNGLGTTQVEQYISFGRILDDDGTGLGNIAAYPLSNDIYIDRCTAGSLPGAPDYGFCVHPIAGVYANRFLFHQSYIYGGAVSPNNSNNDASNYGAGGTFQCWQNSYCACVAENVIYGGIFVGAPVTGAFPSDVVFRYGAWHKPLDWYVGAVDGSSNAFGANPYSNFGRNGKNHLEQKVGNKFAYYGNLMLHSCQANLSGYRGASFAMGARNGIGANVDRTPNGSAWYQVTNIDIHDNDIWRVQVGITSFSYDNTPSSLDAKIRFVNNRILVSPPLSQNVRSEGHLMFGPCTDHLYQNNTLIVNQNMDNGSGGVPTGFYFAQPDSFNPGTYVNGPPYTPGSWHTYQDRFTYKNNITDAGGTNWAFHSDGLLIAPWTMPNVVWGPNLTITDQKAYPNTTAVTGGLYSNVGFVNFQGMNVIPLGPTDWNVTGQFAGLGAFISPPGSVQITTATLPNGTVGTNYSTVLAAIGGSGNYTWTLISASPNWNNAFSLSVGGTLSANPPQMVEVESITIQVADSNNLSNFVQKSFSITVVHQ